MSYTINTKVLGRNVKTRDLVFNPISTYTRAKYDIIVRRIGFTDTGTYSAQRSLWVLTGYDSDNTLATTGGKQTLYGAITGTTDAVVSLYSDAAKTALVAQGTETTRSTGGSVTLAEQNSSGLSGTMTVADACTNDTFTVDIEDYHDRYDADVDGAAANIVGIDNGLSQDSTETGIVATYSLMNLVYEADDVNLDELGKDNVDSQFLRRTLIDNLRLKNINVT